MILFSRDAEWAERLRVCASKGGWSYERQEHLPASTRGAPAEHELVVVDREFAGATPARAISVLRSLFPAAAVVLACADRELGAGVVSAAVSSGADETLGKAWSDAKIFARLTSLRDAAYAAAVRVSADGNLKIERRSHRVFLRTRGKWSEAALGAAEFALLWKLIEREGEIVSRERLLDALRSTLGRAVEAETVSRRILSLRAALTNWPGKVESVRGGFYRLSV
jgi:DNA-binding response OmpR family regulator